MQNISAASPSFQISRDCLEGLHKVRSRGQEYLPKLPLQEWDEYESYAKRAVFYEAPARLRDTYLGLVTRSLPVLTYERAELEPYFNTIMASGQNTYMLSKIVMTEILSSGYCAVLTDFPRDNEQLSEAEARKRNVRPFASFYSAENVFTPEFGVLDNVQIIKSVRLKEGDRRIVECRLDDAGFYEQQIFEQINGVWTPGEIIQPVTSDGRLTEIPIEIISLETDHTKRPKPPLLPICDLALSLYADSADVQQLTKTVAFPTMYAAGMQVDDDDTGSADDKVAKGRKQPVMQLGAGMYIFEDPQASLNWLEHSGAGYQAMKSNMDAKIEMMAKLGSSMLTTDKAAAEAAETVALRNFSSNASLIDMVRIVSTHLTNVLQRTADLLGIEDEVTLQLNTDFDLSKVDLSDLSPLSVAINSGMLSKRTGFEILKRGELIPEDIDFEDEQARISEDDIDR